MNLTKNRLQAIVDALQSRLEKPVPDAIDRKHYRKALAWAKERLTEKTSTSS